MTAEKTDVQKKEKEDIEKLEKFANSNVEFEVLYNLYNKNGSEILFKRLKTYFALLNYPTVKPSLAEFKTLKDLESFILDNKKWLNISTTLNTLEDDGKREMLVRENLEIDGLKKISRKLFPDLNSPFLDKAISLFRKDRYKFEDVLGACNKWVESKDFFKHLNINFDNYKSYSEIKEDIENKLNVFLEIRKKLKMFPTSFKKGIEQEFFTKGAKFSTATLSELEENISNRLHGSGETKLFYAALTEEHNTYDKIYTILHSFNRQYDLSKLKRAAKATYGANVVYHGKDILIIRVKNYHAAEEIGCERWCLVKNENRWKQYVTEKKNNFYIIYNLKDFRSQMVGVCLRDQEVRDVYNQNNSEDIDYVNRNSKLIKALAKYDDSSFKFFRSLKFEN